MKPQNLLILSFSQNLFLQTFSHFFLTKASKTAINFWFIFRVWKKWILSILPVFSLLWWRRGLLKILTLRFFANVTPSGHFLNVSWPASFVCLQPILHMDGRLIPLKPSCDHTTTLETFDGLYSSLP